MSNVFDINNFNIIKDEENYYFVRVKNKYKDMLFSIQYAKRCYIYGK